MKERSTVMNEKGRLIYKEKLKDRKRKTEVNSDQIGIYLLFMFLLLIWTILIYELWKGVEILFGLLGSIIALILTIVLFFPITYLWNKQMIRNMPIKVYEHGLSMPTTLLQRRLNKRSSFIHFNSLERMRIVISPQPLYQNAVLAITKKGEKYIKHYEPESQMPRKLAKIVKKVNPQTKVEILEE